VTDASNPPQSNLPASFVPTEEQARILQHALGRHGRILAGPGTGKSATLVALLTQLMSQDPKPRARLLTFTRAATAELAFKMSQHPATAAVRPSTVHSFALSILMQNPGAGELPAPVRIADDLENQFVVFPTLARRIGVTPTEVKKLVTEMASNWESLRQDEDPDIDPELRRRFLGGWHEHRRIFGYTLLQELPFALRQALADHPELRGVSYDLLIVDEYQDLNACDLDVLKKLAERGCVIIGAGDDDQSIYSWRKADPAGIRNFLEDYPGADDYPLSVTQRCGSKIIEWAQSVLEGDPDRPQGRPPLTPKAGSPEGEVALLSFSSESREVDGVARMVQGLIEEGVLPEDILILLRGDHNGQFSRPIKDKLLELGVICADTDFVKRVLKENQNRTLLAILRLLTKPDDSLAWSTLLSLTPGVGPSFVDHIYARARERSSTFGAVLLEEHNTGFTGAPKVPATKARTMIDGVLARIIAIAPPKSTPENGWAEWILGLCDVEQLPAPTDELAQMLRDVADTVEETSELEGFIGQLRPVAKDRAAAIGVGVRIMSMAASKGLTAAATIVVGAEEGVMPRPGASLSEERRLLYVAMSRAKTHLFVTWVRNRVGPTARAGEGRVNAIRNHSSFLRGGTVSSQEGTKFVSERWPAR